MNQAYRRRFTLASLCVALAACGGSNGDAVEEYQLQFNRNTSVYEDRQTNGEGAPDCAPTYVNVFIERRDGREPPGDLVAHRVTLSRADGSQAWSLPIDQRRSGLYQYPTGRLWQAFAERCSFNRVTGERFNVFPPGSLATLTVELSAGGLNGQLQQHDVYIDR